MSFIGKLVAILFFIALFPEAYSQISSLDWLINTQDIDGKNAIGEHPRGLVKASELEEIRERVAYSPFLEILEKMEALSPEKAAWHTYADTTHSVVVHRNGFKDKIDIVTLINASQKRVAGHKGPDVNTFRVIGMGVPFIIGGGRTNLVAGQSNLFPGKVCSVMVGKPFAIIPAFNLKTNAILKAALWMWKLTKR